MLRWVLQLMLICSRAKYVSAGTGVFVLFIPGTVVTMVQGGSFHGGFFGIDGFAGAVSVFQMWWLMQADGWEP